MAVTITNVGARSIWRQNGTISYGGWTTSDQIQVGYYSANTSYAIQLHFKLDKPCSSIKLQVQGSGSGYVYFKVSNKAEDNEMLTRMFTEGNEPGAIPAYAGQTIEITGNFPADTDLYIYGSNFATYNNIITVYSATTKVTDAVEGNFGSYVFYNDNGTPVKCEVYYNDNGVAKRCDVYYNDNGKAVKT